MRVHLAYDGRGLDVELPPDTRVVEPCYAPGVPDEPTAIRQALCRPIGASPLRQLVRSGDRVVVLYSDITRPMPNERVLPVLLAELEEAGVRCSDIVLLDALGAHRRQTPEELVDMLGQGGVERYRQALLQPCHQVEDTLAELLDRYGPEATVCVLLEGPQTVPYVAKDA